MEQVKPMMARLCKNCAHWHSDSYNKIKGTCDQLGSAQFFLIRYWEESCDEFEERKEQYRLCQNKS